MLYIHMNILIVYTFLLHNQVTNGSGIRMLRLLKALNSNDYNKYAKEALSDVKSL